MLPAKEKGIALPQEQSLNTTSSTSIITRSHDDVRPFPVNNLEASQTFMVEDLAKSGLTVEDMPCSCEPCGFHDHDEMLPAYRMWITPDYPLLRIKRTENKYIGPKGRPHPDVYLGDFANAPIVSTVEGYKKAVAFYKATGIPTNVIFGCWGFGFTEETDEGIKAKALKNGIIARSTPGQIHLPLLDGDWATNDDVVKALATFNYLLEEQAVTPVCPNLGTDLKGNKMGADDWLVAAPRGDTHAAVTEALLRLPRVPAIELSAALSFALGSDERFSSAYFDLTERGTASLLMRHYGPENLRYLSDLDQWASWTGSSWQLYPKRYIALVNTAARHYHARASVLYAQASKIGSPEKGSDLAKKQANLLSEADKLTKWANGPCSSVAGRTAIMNDLTLRLELRDVSTSFDADPNIINCPNGVLDLQTGELRPQTQADKLLQSTTVPYPTTEPTGPGVDKLKRFLAEITGLPRDKHGVSAPDPVMETYLQRRLGASLRGANMLTSLEIWHGEGANGKSALAKAIQALLGKTSQGGYSATIGADTILSKFKGRDPEAATPFLMLAIKARAVFVAETKDTDHLNESITKQLTGDDEFTARGNYKDGASYGVRFNVFLLTNHLPSVNEGGAAIWDRLAPTPFSVRWQRPDKPIIDEHEKHLPKGDRWFLDGLPKDTGALQYLFWWMVQGGIAWEREGLGEAPERVLTALRAYQEANNKYADWMAEMGWVFDEDAKTLCGDVYNDFKNWSLERGGMVPQSQIVMSRLRSAFPRLKSVRSNGRQHIGGIRKRTEKF